MRFSVTTTVLYRCSRVLLLAALFSACTSQEVSYRMRPTKMTVRTDIGSYSGFQFKEYAGP